MMPVQQNPSRGRHWLLIMITVLMIGTGESLDILAPKLLGTAKKQASDVKEAPPSLLSAKPPEVPNNVMGDSNLTQAVEIWCNNPTQAEKFFGHISRWNTSLVTNFRALFRRQTHFNDDISKWDTSRGTTMASMFEDCQFFDQDLSSWDTSNVLTMSAMFANAASFTGTKGSMARWNVEKVARMDRMFKNAILFQGDLSHWKTKMLHHVSNMFQNALNYKGGQDLANWDTREFKDMTGMFLHAIRFEGNISNWNVSSAIEMDETFENAISFSGDLSSWDTRQVVTMSRMFRNATSFTGLGNGGGIAQWNVENVRNFFAMFEDNPSFTANISGWNPAKATNMERMFFNATSMGKGSHLKETISEKHAFKSSQFKLLCWQLPNAQVRTQDAFCGSFVRFDPCCVSTVQFETSCCNRFCYNVTKTCEDHEHDQGAFSQYHYGASSGNLYHDELGLGIEEGESKTNAINWEASIVIGVIVVLVMCCVRGMFKFL